LDAQHTSKLSDSRETINEVLKNIHGSLKWFWQLIMGFAMAQAVGMVSVTLLENPRSHQWVPTILFVVAFVPTFIRFYFGHARHLDIHYIEDRRWRPEERFFPEVRACISPLRWWIDVVRLLTHGIIFVLLARLLGSNTFLFFCFYVGLLVINVAYLPWTHALTKSRRPRRRLREIPRTDGPVWWIINNTSHAIVMTALISWCYAYPVSLTSLFWPLSLASTNGLTLQYTLLLLLCATNSIVDLYVTHNWYFPSLDRALDLEVRS
jgi:hypothetical protein